MLEIEDRRKVSKRCGADIEDTFDFRRHNATAQQEFVVASAAAHCPVQCEIDSWGSNSCFACWYSIICRNSIRALDLLLTVN